MSEVKRQLKIKTGSVKRLAKELVMYTKDKDVENTRVENLRAAKGDASDIKHAVSLLLSSFILLLLRMFLPIRSV